MECPAFVCASGESFRTTWGYKSPERSTSNCQTKLTIEQEKTNDATVRQFKQWNEDLGKQTDKHLADFKRIQEKIDALLERLEK